HRGLVNRCGEVVFNALVYLAGKYERLFPSIKGLAYLARSCPQSVKSALNQLEAFGIVTRHRRLKQVMAPGFKVVPATNSYEIRHLVEGRGDRASDAKVIDAQPARQPASGKGDPGKRSRASPS